MPETEINIEQKLGSEIWRIIKESKIDIQYSWSDKQQISYADFFSDKMLIVSLIRLGIPYSLFNLIEQYTPFNEKDWAVLLDISTKTLQRYKHSSRDFKPIQSEK